MQEKRLEPRMLCADLVHLEWRDAEGVAQQAVANLEDISPRGACLQVDDPVPLDTQVRIRHHDGDLTGRIRYCVYREIGFFMGIEFEPGSHWRSESFKPQHLFDPRRLAVQSTVEDTAVSSN